MKQQFTQHDLDGFFEEFKNLPEITSINKVHQLINNPTGMANQGVKPNLFNLKYIIMSSSILVVGLMSLWLFFKPSSDENITNKQEESKQTEIVLIDEEKESDEPELANNQETVLSKQIQKTSMDEVIVEPESKTTKEVRLSNTSVVTKQEVVIESADPKLVWPKDSILNGSQFMVYLADDELEKLGFMVHETGFYYKNKTKGVSKCFHTRFENKTGESTWLSRKPHAKNKIVDFSSHSFYPYTISKDVTFRDTPDYFKLANDTLCPVLVSRKTLKYGTTSILFWFITNDDLFNVLPTRYAHMREHYARLKQVKEETDANLVVYESMLDVVTSGLHLINLNKPQLEAIGFTIADTLISTAYTIDSMTTNLRIKKGSTSVSAYRSGNKVFPNLDLLYCTNEYGQQSLSWKTPKDKSEGIFEGGDKDLLVPIVLRQKDYSSILSEDLIFWFRPNDVFFKLLPRSIGEQLKKEYDYIVSDAAGLMVDGLKPAPECIYFEECQQSHFTDDLKLFPNPASEFINVQFSLDEAIRGEIILSSISGRKIRTLESKTFWSGQNKMKYSLSQLQPGLYLILIKTDEGNVSKRFILK